MIQVESDIVCAIKESLKEHLPELNNWLVKIYWCRKSRIKTCDLVVSHHLVFDHHLVSTSEWRQKLAMELVHQSKTWTIPLDKCEVVEDRRLQLNIWLNRSAMAKAVLMSIDEGSFGKINDPAAKKRRALVRLTPWSSCEKYNVERLTDLRTEILMQLTRNMLEMACPDNMNNIHVSNCPLDCKLITLTRANITGQDENSQMMGYVKDDMSDSVSTDVRHACHLEHVFSHARQPLDDCILITSKQKEQFAMQGRKIWQTKTELEHRHRPCFVDLFHGPVIWKGDSTGCSTPCILFRTHRDAVEKSFEHKYGRGIAKNNPHGDNVTTMLATLADFNIKFDMLICNPSKTVHLKDSADGSSGTFVMYNYTRIHAVVSSFEKGVCKENFLPLPPLADVDLSLLQKEEEWSIVLLLAKYPKLIKEIVNDLYSSNSGPINPPFHKIMEFLSELSHCVSVYYSRVRVLVPAPHLRDIMYARIWLLMCIKRIMEAIFKLLDISPIQLM